MKENAIGKPSLSASYPPQKWAAMKIKIKYSIKKIPLRPAAPLLRGDGPSKLERRRPKQTETKTKTKTQAVKRKRGEDERKKGQEKGRRRRDEKR